MGLISFLKQNGFFVTLEEIIARFRLWDLDPSDFLELGSGSSFSDNQEYLSIVALASRSDQIFSKFRSNRQYRKILEHVTKELGSSYLRELTSRVDVRKSFQLLKDCDTTGGPIRYYFRGLGFFSPTTIRYAYFHSEFNKCFGDLSGLRVIEIGGGFGGQAAVSSTLTESLEWVIFDLPEVLSLQERYLNDVNPNANIIFNSGLEISQTSGDILVSNYALSEISRDLQMEYLNKVVLNCKKGYMVWNTISENQNGGLGLSDLLSMIPCSTAIGENPLSSPGNVIVTWG